MHLTHMSERLYVRNTLGKFFFHCAICAICTFSDDCYSYIIHYGGSAVLTKANPYNARALLGFKFAACAKCVRARAKLSPPPLVYSTYSPNKSTFLSTNKCTTQSHLSWHDGFNPLPLRTARGNCGCRGSGGSVLRNKIELSRICWCKIPCSDSDQTQSTHFVRNVQANSTWGDEKCSKCFFAVDSHCTMSRLT